MLCNFLVFLPQNSEPSHSIFSKATVCQLYPFRYSMELLVLRWEIVGGGRCGCGILKTSSWDVIAPHAAAAVGIRRKVAEKTLECGIVLAAHES
jgi:hypothetical protein